MASSGTPGSGGAPGLFGVGGGVRAMAVGDQRARVLYRLPSSDGSGPAACSGSAHHDAAGRGAVPGRAGRGARVHVEGLAAGAAPASTAQAATATPSPTVAASPGTPSRPPPPPRRRPRGSGHAGSRTGSRWATRTPARAPSPPRPTTPRRCPAILSSTWPGARWPSTHLRRPPGQGSPAEDLRPGGGLAAQRPRGHRRDQGRPGPAGWATPVGWRWRSTATARPRSPSG